MDENFMLKMPVSNDRSRSPIRPAVSFDPAAIEKNNSKKRSEKKKRKKRMVPTDPQLQLMRELTFEVIELGATPLSSLRSCSEFHRMHSWRREREKPVEPQKRERSRGFWSKFGRWLIGSSSGAHNKRHEADKFLMENVCHSAEKMRQQREQENPSHSKQDPRKDTQSKTTRRERGGVSSWLRGNREQSSLLRESSAAVEYIFGLPDRAHHAAQGHEDDAMEIELKDLKSEYQPVYFAPPSFVDPPLSFSRSLSLTAALSPAAIVRERDTESEMVAVESARSSRAVSLSVSVGERETERDAPRETVRFAEREIETPALPAALSDSLSPTQTLRDTLALYVCAVWERSLALLRKALPPTPRDDALYDALRLQPFTAGVFLRGLLLSGASSACFHAYHLLTWSAPGPGVPRWLRNAMYAYVVVQTLLHALQAPLRTHIHFLCWETSRAADRDASMAVLRGMLRGDAWLLNRVLGRAGNSLFVLLLVCVSLYLFLSPLSHNDGSSSAEREDVRALLLSLCASSIVPLLCRVVVSVCFSLSSTDPYVIAEARKRGLSRGDIENFPQFSFSRSALSASPGRALGSHSECAICLCDYEEGERLTCLPCDAKHNFHTQCIEHWLSRQNSCPLCQSML